MKTHIAWLFVSAAALLLGMQFAKKEVQIVEKPVEIVKTKELVVEKPVEVTRDAPKKRDSSGGVQIPTAVPKSSNSAILNFLGEPVQAPGNLDPKYSPKELSAAFQAVCDAVGIKVERLGVDTTEFPFVVHGLVDRQSGDFFRRLQEQLKQIPGYTYAGSTTGRTKDGSASYFAMSITPEKAYAPEQAEAIRRRLMLRIQMIGAAWQDPAQ